ncbi:hypothetical protein [Saliphagus sp. LR7]|uniref:hypothetical protein n=1 Tax=Saliphagus sp. LR7 TaxID=2282654 RepID=UPI000DF7A08D|nr:hypothetical protein [Saliphagus sp. LR7]
MTDEPIRSLEPRTIGGTEVLVSTEADEIFLDIPATGQDYIRVVEGEIVREGDIRTRDGRDLDSPTLRAWRVDEITAEHVRGSNVDTDDPNEWDRESLEQELADGTLSTDLTDFERADVPQRAEIDSGNAPSEVSVTIYGNNGQRFQQTFAPADDGETSDRRLELARSDPKVETFDDDLREKFTRAVEIALRSEGYAV